MDQVSASERDLPLMQHHRNLVPYGHLDEHETAENISSANRPELHVEHMAGISLACHRKRARDDSTRFWLVVAYIVGVSVLFSLCGRARKVHERTTVRRLASGDEGDKPPSGQNPLYDEDEWISLDADDLASLCVQVGEWTPAMPLEHIPSASQAVPKAAPSTEVQWHRSSVSSSGSHMMPAYPQVAEENVREVGGDKRTQQMVPDEAVPGPSWKADDFAGGSSVGRAAAFQRSFVQTLPKTVQPTADLSPSHSIPPGVLLLPSLFAHQPGFTTQGVWGQSSAQGQPMPQPFQKHNTLGAAQYASLGSPETSPQSIDEARTPQAGSGPFASSAKAAGPKVEPPLAHRQGIASRDHRVERQTTKLLLRQMILAKPGALASTSDSHTESDTTAAGLSPPQLEFRVKHHPFTRLPRLDPDVRPECIKLGPVSPLAKHEPMILQLKVIRRLSLQTSINLSEASELLDAARRMASRALFTMAAPVDEMKPSRAAESLGRRFLAFSAIHGVLHVLGNTPELKALWNAMVAGVPTTYSHKPRLPIKGKYGFHYKLAKQLSSALELYKLGGAPTPLDIVELKRKIFCMPLSPKCFLESSWSLWRKDEEDWGGYQ